MSRQPLSAILWMRRDLRIKDNHALLHALIVDHAQARRVALDLFGAAKAAQALT